MMAYKKWIAAGVLAPALMLTGCSNKANDEGDTTTPTDSSPSSVGSNASDGETPSAEAPTPVVQLNVSGNKVAIDKTLEVAVENSDQQVKAVKVSGTRFGEMGESEKPKVKLPGTMNSNVWQAASFLEPSTNYNVTVVLEDGSKLKEKFSTKKLSLSDQTYATVFPSGVSNVGIAQPIVVRFDLPVEEKTAVSKSLKVTTSPAQAGAWHWYSDTEARWRPKNYWKPGTQVQVDAKLNSVPVGGGRYGQFDVAGDFKITKVARKVKVNMDTHQMTVYKNDKVIKTIAISTGREPSYTTRSGTKVIMSKHRYYDMNSSSIGIDPNSAEGYDLSDVEYAMRLTNSGEFIHAAPWNAGYFGNSNQSHGCTGGMTADIGWLYNYVEVGDPVEYVGSDRPMTPENGWGDWNLSWKKYKNA